MRIHCFVLVVAAASSLSGCAWWRGDAELPRTSAVPPAGPIVEAKPASIGNDTIGRYGGDFASPASAGTVTPIISLMPVAAPQYGPPGMVRPRYAFAPYPPPPPSPAEPVHEPYSDAVARAVAGGVIGGIVGAQFGSGSGRHVAAGVGAAVGSVIGLASSNIPCATPHGGTLAGAAAGGVLGNQIGSGSGRSAATALGAMIGAIAGTQAGSNGPGCR